MDTYRRLGDLPAIEGSALTIGTFDGLHKGHLAVIDRLRMRAAEKQVPAAVLTFDPHPQHMLAPSDMPRKELLITLDQKIALLDRSGVDVALVLTFDREFSLISADDFLQKIVVDRFHPTDIVVGYDHHFGHDRKGNARFLQQHAPRFGYEVDVVEVVSESGSTISSSQIRQFLREGKCEEAAQMLGRPYEIPGAVAAGIGRGQTLAFPTANLIPDEPAQLIPEGGAYVVSANIGGQITFGMCNVGYRPTFNGSKLTIETHFFDPPEENLYNQRLAFRFHHRLRDERKFDSVEELQDRLDRDKQLSMNWIAEYQGGKHIHAPV